MGSTIRSPLGADRKSPSPNQTNKKEKQTGMNIKSFNKFAFAGAAALVLATNAAIAGDSKKTVAPVVEESEPILSGAVTLGYDSKYMFRGVRIAGESDNADNLFWADANVSAFGFNLGAWYAYSLDGDDYDEVDVYLSYTLSAGSFDFTVGGILYVFPFADEDDYTYEAYGKVAFTGVDFLTPSIAYYYDFELFEGGYIEFRLDSSIPLIADKLSLDPYALISYDFEYNSDDNDLNHVQAGLALVYSVTDSLTVKAYAAVSEPLDAIDDSQDTEFWGGGSVSFSF